MSLRDNPLGEVRVPLTWTAGTVFVIVLIVSATLLMSDQRESFDTDAYGRARTTTDRALEPVGEAISAPGRWTGAGIDTIRGYFFAVSENRRLKAELKEMRQWRDVAIALRDNNDRYRALLDLKTDPPIPMAAARIVTDSRGPFAHSRLANAGADKGIRQGHPVMSENGLVGRVVGVGEGVSRVLLLTDPASRTPVMIDRTNARAILAGDGGPNPRLDYMRGQNPVRQGDRVLTSGDGGIFPRGLPVGVAVRGIDGAWRVALFADHAPIDYVRILLFEDFAQVAAARREMDNPPPPPPTGGGSTLPPAAGVTMPADPRPAAATEAPPLDGAARARTTPRTAARDIETPATDPSPPPAANAPPGSPPTPTQPTGTRP